MPDWEWFIPPIYRETYLSLWIQILAEKELNPPNHAPNTPSEATWIYRIWFFMMIYCGVLGIQWLRTSQHITKLAELVSHQQV